MNEAPQVRRPITSWEVIEKAPPYGNPLKKLRLQVTYADGRVRMLAPSFRDRAELDKYVARFHEDFAGKEVSTTKEGPDA